MSKYLNFILILGACQLLSAQPITKHKIHSHNDYEQEAPFYEAYKSGCSSIEVDIFLKGGQLFATHSEEDIRAGRTLETLYLEPLAKLYKEHQENTRVVQLLIDIKSGAEETLQVLVAILQKYPGLIQSKAVSFVVSGNRPLPEAYPGYPPFIYFDYQSLEIPEDSTIINKIALISLDFHSAGSWNGRGNMPKEEQRRVRDIVNRAHNIAKPFRFWGCPDSENAWKVFAGLGVDFINTDKPAECAAYFKKRD